MHSTTILIKKVKKTEIYFLHENQHCKKCWIMPPDWFKQNDTFYKVLLICLLYYFIAIIMFRQQLESSPLLPRNGRLLVLGVGQGALELDTGAALSENLQGPLHAETGHWTGSGVSVKCRYNVTKLPRTVSSTNMLSFFVMLIWHSYRPLSLGLTELKKIMSEYVCCCFVPQELEDNSRQNYQVSAKFSQILFCSVLFELFANATQNLQTASFVVELYLFLFQQYLLSVKFLIVSTTFY